MATIKIFINAFPTIVIPNIDVTTIRFYGPTNGYDYLDDKDHSTIGFVVENAEQIVKNIQEGFKLNPEHSTPDKYIWVKDRFDDYVKDKRPRIGVRLDNGLRGLSNPPSFEIIAG
jgi:hypothetical protein